MSHELPLLAKEILRAGGFWRRETQFSLWVWTLVSQPRSSAWDYPKVIKKKDKKNMKLAGDEEVAGGSRRS